MEMGVGVQIESRKVDSAVDGRPPSCETGQILLRQPFHFPRPGRPNA